MPLKSRKTGVAVIGSKMYILGIFSIVQASEQNSSNSVLYLVLQLSLCTELDFVSLCVPQRLYIYILEC
jgi:hypothetical protein